MDGFKIVQELLYFLQYKLLSNSLFSYFDFLLFLGSCSFCLLCLLFFLLCLPSYIWL